MEPTHGLRRPTWRPRAWLITGATFVVLFAALLAVGAKGPLSVVLPSMIAATAVAVASWAVRRTRLDRVGYEARLTGWASSQAALAERMRIARDLHDIVSHGLGLITVRVAAARHVMAGRGDGTFAEVSEALADIETASRNATAELRRMLTVLRTSDETAGPRLPVDGLHQIPNIVSAAEVAGLRTSLTVEPMGDVSAGAQGALCKVVREALNNSARHAGPTEVRVHLYRDGDTAVATVSDGGPGSAWRSAPGAGHGLIGLRERVCGLGGSFHAEPAETGFRITARIPDRTAG